MGHSPDVFLETGTFFGFTTRFFIGQGIPVYSAEIRRSYAAAARLRLGVAPELRLRRAESLTVVKEVRSKGFKRPFVYLDAHWYDDLPLGREISDLFEGDGDTLIVVDDFQVPHDPGYGYDEYKGVPLGLEMIDVPPDAIAAVPAGEASGETGARRGTLYLGRGERAFESLQAGVAAGLLRPAAGETAAGASDRKILPEDVVLREADHPVGRDQHGRDAKQV